LPLDRFSPETKEGIKLHMKYMIIPMFLWFLLYGIVFMVFMAHPEWLASSFFYVVIPMIVILLFIMVYGSIKLRRKIKRKKIIIKTETFKKAGILLIAIGLLDICWMIEAIIERVNYASSLNIFAIIAGVSLIRGNMSAVRYTRWNVALILSLVIAGIFVLPFVGPVVEPPELFKIRFKLNPWSIIISSVLFFSIVSLLCAVHYLLNRKESLDALKQAGFKTGRPKFAYLGGTTIIAGLCYFSVPMLKGEKAEKAKSMAQEEFGSEYKYHVSGFQSSGNKTTAFVTAYNENEIKTVEVSW
jgi:hypothetical protein